MSEKENKTTHKELSQGQHSQIIGAFWMVHKPLSIIKTFGFSRQTVYRITKHYNQTGSEDTIKHQGSPESLSECDKHALNHIASNNH